MSCTTVTCLLLALGVAGCLSLKCYPKSYQVTKDISYNHPRFGGLQSSIDYYYDATNERLGRYISYYNSSFINVLRFVHVRTNDIHYFVDKKYGWCHSWKAAPFREYCLSPAAEPAGKDYFIGTKSHGYKATPYVFKTKTQTGYFEANTVILNTLYPVKFMLYDSKMNLKGNIDYNNGLKGIPDESFLDKPKECTNVKETNGAPATYLDLEQFFEF